MTVATAIEGNFPPEHPIYDDKIHYGEAHAEAPPDQADVQGMWAGDGFLDSNVVRRIIAGGKQPWIECDRRADQHKGQITARADEGFVVLLFAGKI